MEISGPLPEPAARVGSLNSRCGINWQENQILGEAGHPEMGLYFQRQVHYSGGLHSANSEPGPHRPHLEGYLVSTSMA